MTQPIIVFDLDGTLALDSHRTHHLLAKPKDWATYFALCEQDAPNLPVISLYQALSFAGRHVEIWTGRIDEYEAETKRWLSRHLTYAPARLRMRPKDSRTNDDEMKRQWLAETRQRGGDVILAFEDRKRVVEMWRSEGVLCCQVAPGEF